MKKINACIFDLDGVVVDTARFHYQAWRKLANGLGFDFTEHQNESLKGVSRMKSLDLILDIGQVSLSQEKKETLAAEKNEFYLQLISKMNEQDVLPGVKEFILELRAANIKVALGSASKNARTILKQIALTPYFDTIVDGTQTTKAKPDPQVFLKGAKALETEATTCVVFEDAIAGVQAAKAGGMTAIGVGNPKILHQADYVIDGFKEFNLTKLQSLSL